jgi:hypothetical protein
LGVHWASNSQSESPLGNVWVHSLTPSYIHGSIKCDSWTSFSARIIASPYISREPKARVMTFMAFDTPLISILIECSYKIMCPMHLTKCFTLWCFKNYVLLMVALWNSYLSFIVFMFVICFSITIITLKVSSLWSF